jgi:hypothetical protein
MNPDFNTRTTLSTRAIIGIAIGGGVAVAIGLVIGGVKARGHKNSEDEAPAPVRPEPQIVQTSYSEVTETRFRF